MKQTLPFTSKLRGQNDSTPSRFLLLKKISRPAGIFALALIANLFLLGNVFAQGTMGRYEVCGLSGATVSVTASGVGSNLTFSALARGVGVNAASSTGGFISTGWATSTTLTVSNNDYYEFTITPAAGFPLSIGAIRFRDQVSTGTTFGAYLRSSADNYASNLATWTASTTVTNRSIALTSVAALQARTTAITFRLYGTGAASNSTTTYGIFCDNTNTTFQGKWTGIDVDGTYKSQLVSMNLGSSTWCSGETRNVQIQIKNIGTAPWVDGNGRDFNIGIKWNTNGSNWTDYYIRTDANLLPGATGTYTLPITASNNTGAGYTTGLAAGSNNLIFDVVMEGLTWFGDNNPPLTGSGNAKFTSAAQTINAIPAINAMTGTACSGNAFTVTPVNGTNGTVPAGTTYSWSAPAVTGSMTGGAAGSGASNINGTLTNPTTTAQTATYTVTPSNGPCPGTSFTVTVTVNPKSSISAMTATTCSAAGFSVTPVDGVNGTVISGTTYSWTAPSVTGGLTGGAASSGSPASISGTLTNPTNAVQTATYTVTPTTSGCAGSTFTVTVTVNPKPAITAINTSVCDGAPFAITPANGTNGIVPAGTTYSWSAPVVTGGMTGGAASSGASNISDVFTNPTNSPQTATYTVTPVAGTCTGSNFTITVTVNPIPVINAMAATKCSGTAFIISPVNGTDGLVPTNATYSWPAPVVNGGITGGTASSGSPTNINGTLTNPTTDPQIATYTVTPTSGSCTGSPFDVTVTVNPKPVLTSTLTPSAICSGDIFTYTPTANISGTTFTWTRAAVTGISNAAITSPQAADPNETLTNTTNAALNVVYAYTLTLDGCSYTQNVTVSVNPKPAINNMASTICSAGSFTATPVNSTNGIVPAGTTYNWSAPSVTGGLTGGAASIGSPTNISGTLTNPTNTVQTATYTVTPTSGSCTGNSFTVTVTVNPKATISAMTSTICSATGFTATPANGTNGVVPAGTTYSWSAPVNANVTGLAAGSAQTSISGTLTNTSNAVQTVIYTVTPTSPGSCAGSSFTVTVTVNPKATITAMTTSVCSGSDFTATPVNVTNGIVPAGTTYSWSAPSVTGGVTGGTSGNGSPITGTLVNPTNAPQTATYSVTPLSGSCSGAAFTLTVTVNPIPVTTGAAICQNGSGTLTSSTACYTPTVTAGPNLPLTGANINSGGTAWTNPTRVTANDDSYVTVAATSGFFSATTVTSQTLSATQFGFNIPSNALIGGIQVTIGHKSSSTSASMKDVAVQLVKAGAVTGTNLGLTSTSWGTAETAQAYGSSSNLWGTTWSPAEINATNFGASLKMTIVTPADLLTTYTASVDYFQITVTYTLPGSLRWYTASSGGQLIGSGSPFNPVGVVNSGLPNAATPGTTTFYAECSNTPGCRTSADFVINPLPSLILVNNHPSITRGDVTAEIPWDNISDNPDVYSIVWTGSPAGFNNVANDFIPEPSFILAIPANANAGTYNGNLTVKNSATGCTSVNNPFQVTINPTPVTITPDAGQSKVYGNADPVFTYSASPGLTSPDLFTGQLSRVTGEAIGNYAYTLGNLSAGSNYTLNLGGSNTFSIGGLSQLTADFRSRINGNFSVSSTWEYDMGGNNWTGAAQAPTSANNVSILHDIILDQDYTNGSGKTLGLGGGSLSINPGKTLKIAGTTNFNGRLVTLKSDATGTGSIGNITGTLSNATNVTIERFIPNNGFRSWRLLSVPTYGNGQTIRQAWQEGNVNPNPLNNNLPGYGTQITGTGSAAAAMAAGFDNTSGNAALLSWNGSAWIPVNTTNTAIDNIKSYFLFIRGDRTRGVAGVNNNTTPTTLRTNGTVYTGDQASGPLQPNSFNLIANLYPSAIQFDALDRTGSVANTFYVWDSKKQNSNGSLGVYQTFIGTNGFNTPITGGSYGASNKIIESGQSFFVPVGASGGTITLKESSKINSNSALGFRPASPVSTLMKLDSRLITNNNVTDANVVVFDNAYSNAVDGNDAVKLSNPAENFGILRDAKILAVEGRQVITDTDTLQFKMWNLQQQSYQLQFEPANLGTSGLSAWLEDSYLHTSTPVDLGVMNNISFTVDANAGSSSGRFRIVFRQAAPLPLTFTSISAGRNGNAIEVSWKVASERNILRYEIERSIDGRNFSVIGTVAAAGNTASESDYRFKDASAPSKVVFYRIKSIGTGNDVKYTNAVKVIADNVRPGFAVSPNPVQNGIVNLQFTNQAEGKYSIRILNNAGQTVFTRTVVHEGGSSTQVLNLPAGMITGSYRAEITAPDKTETVKALFIENK